MPELMYATRCELPGPWLICRDALTAFDELMDEEFGRLRTIRDGAYADAVAQRVDELRNKYSSAEFPEDELNALARQHLDWREEYRVESRIINIRFKSGKRISVDRFEQAFRVPEIEDELPIGFAANYTCGAVRASVDIVRSFPVPELSIAVSPETDQNAKELYAVLRTWASSMRPTWFQWFWSRATPWQWMAFFFLLGIFASTAPDSGSFYRQQGRTMLEKGLKPGDELKAIEIILALESRYSAPSQQQTFGLRPRRLAALLLGGIVVCGILSAAPKFALGVAKGEGRIKFWRFYEHAISVVIPLTFLSWFVWPRVISIVQHWFS